MYKLNINRVVSIFLLATGIALGHASMAATMIDTPLQVGATNIPPNLIFTLDDSGSMWWECVPDDLCQAGTYGLETVPRTDGIVGNYSNRMGTAIYDDANVVNVLGGVVLAAAPNLLSRQLRSNAYNPMYYDPATLYLPWRNADGTRWPNSPPSAAPARPGVAVLQNLEGIQTIGNYRWCSYLSVCYNSTSQSAHLARYYNMTGTGSSASDFTLVKIASGQTYPKSANRTDCSGSTCSYAEEIQNFANWYTYYRTRALTAIAGTAEAFYDIPSNYRLGYGRINKGSASNIDGVSTTTLERGVRPFSGLDKTDFYIWLQGRGTPVGGTPLRRAMDDVGQYFSRADNAGPWAAVPGGSDSSAHASCRRSVHLLMTDGMWNGAGASTAEAAGNADGTAGSTITGPGGQSYQYTAALPYSDSFSGTLADVAMHYWKTDLRPDLANSLTPIATPGRENPAFWQHMVNFTIAFGVNGTLNNPGDLAALKSGTKAWPNSTLGGAGTIDDLWHAALNSRGKALSARNAVEYSNAVKSILSDIAAGNGSEAGVGVSQQTLPSIGSATKKYTPSFSSPAWNGDVLAENIDGNAVVASTAWSAAAQLPLPANRNIFTYDPLAAAGSRGIEFKWSSLSTVMKAALSPTLIDGDLLVNYLRGDRTGEGLIYRKRTTPLGDIVNSTPALVFDQVDFYYEYLPYGFGGAAYRRFVRAKSLRQAQLFVGANDGMLHAFNDSSGAESFAFMPRSVLGSVNLLSKLDYSHRYFVDGPIQETDVFERSTNLWRNFIQATGGAGGKYVYSINVPVPYWAATSNTAPAALDAAASAPGAADIRWEVSDSTTGFGELGYVLTKPETGVTRDGTWITVFGNGYQSASGKAQLFIVNALTGALIKKIDTGVGSVASPNGLGGVGVVRDSQQQIVAVYAGDLAGNLWKFDLSSTSQSNWAVAFDGAPLFKAKNSAGQAEPVTAKPVFRAFPTGGVMVLFGAGKLFEQGDQSSTAGRTLYGVWDKVAIGDGAGTASDALADSSSLVTQNVTTAPVSGANSAVYRKLTVTPVDYATKRGWRLPLVIGVGERMVDDPQVRFDYVFMQSVTLTGVEDQCQSAKMIRRGYLLDPFMSGTLKPPFDVNGDGAYNSTDDANIVDLTGTGSNSVVAQTGSRTTCVGTNCTGAQTCPKSGLIIGAGSSGGIEACFGPNAIRRAWREIVTTP